MSISVAVKILVFGAKLGFWQFLYYFKELNASWTLHANNSLYPLHATMS